MKNYAITVEGKDGEPENLGTYYGNTPKEAFNNFLVDRPDFEGEAEVKLLGLPKGVSVREPLPRITAASKEVIFQLQATDEALLGPVTGLECELTVHTAGQEIRQRTGKGNLRIDPAL